MYRHREARRTDIEHFTRFHLVSLLPRPVGAGPGSKQQALATSWIVLLTRPLFREGDAREMSVAESVR
jgi:hypothetical protein